MLHCDKSCEMQNKKTTTKNMFTIPQSKKIFLLNTKVKMMTKKSVKPVLHTTPSQTFLQYCLRSSPNAELLWHHKATPKTFFEVGTQKGLFQHWAMVQIWTVMVLSLTSPYLQCGKVCLEMLSDVCPLGEGLVAQRTHQGWWHTSVGLHVSLQVLFTCR